MTLTEEEKNLLRGIRGHKGPINRERLCQIASTILYSTSSGFEPAPDNNDSYLGEHEIKRTLARLEERGYVESDENNHSLIRPSNLIPLEIYRDSNS